MCVCGRGGSGLGGGCALRWGGTARPRGWQGLTLVAFIFYYFFFLPLALVSLADVAAGGGRGSSVIAWDLGASLSSPFSSPAAAGVAKDFS